jgi:hypothetical protein
MGDKINNEEIRKYIIENYKDQIPDIENHIYHRRDKVADFSHIVNSAQVNPIFETYKNLVFSIIDIRNNSDPISPESNTIIKSDNNFANETKAMVKILLAKGWNYDDVAFEMERIYGQGIISRKGFFEKTPIKEYLICTTYITLFSYAGYRTFRPVFRFITNKLKSFI